MTRITEIDGDNLARSLAYAGYVLLAFELAKGLIVKPIKYFYSRATFGPGMPFKSYEEDAMSRHKNEFQACLLYLRDFMEAIDADDFVAIQRLREHRNELAHDLPSKLPTLDITTNQLLLDAAHKALFKLSNYRTYMEVGHDPALRGVDWTTVKGHEQLTLEAVLDKIRLLKVTPPDA
jgi:hypothetical protein